MIVWFTGLSGVGKSTLAQRVGAELVKNRSVEVLDGDELRKMFFRDLGFTKADRDMNAQRVGFIARAVARAGGIAICATISPYRAARDEIRAAAEKDGVRFVEIALTAPLDVLEQRDTKGLYAKARRGELKNFTGVDDPYEPPLNPELRLDTSALSEDACFAAILKVVG